MRAGFWYGSEFACAAVVSRPRLRVSVSARSFFQSSVWEPPT